MKGIQIGTSSGMTFTRQGYRTTGIKSHHPDEHQMIYVIYCGFHAGRTKWKQIKINMLLASTHFTHMPESCFFFLIKVWTKQRRIEVHRS